MWFDLSLSFRHGWSLFRLICCLDDVRTASHQSLRAIGLTLHGRGSTRDLIRCHDLLYSEYYFTLPWYKCSELPKSPPFTFSVSFNVSPGHQISYLWEGAAPVNREHRDSKFEDWSLAQVRHISGFHIAVGLDASR